MLLHYPIALLLLPTKETPLIDPLQKGDRLPFEALRKSIKAAPRTHPVSLFKGQKLLLHGHRPGEGTVLACFPDLRPLVQGLPGRVHLLGLTPQPFSVLHTGVGNSSQQQELPVSFFTEANGGLFFRGGPLPQLLLITTKGVLVAGSTGYFLTGKNIRKVAAGATPLCLPPRPPYQPTPSFYSTSKPSA